MYIVINNNNCQLVGCAVKPWIVTLYFAIRVSLHTSKALFQQFLRRESLSRCTFDLLRAHRNAHRKWLNHRVSNSLVMVSPLSANPPRAAARLPSMTLLFCREQQDSRTKSYRNLQVEVRNGSRESARRRRPLDLFFSPQLWQTRVRHSEIFKNSRKLRIRSYSISKIYYCETSYKITKII